MLPSVINRVTSYVTKQNNFVAADAANSSTFTNLTNIRKTAVDHTIYLGLYSDASFSGSSYKDACREKYRKKVMSRRVELLKDAARKNKISDSDLKKLMKEVKNHKLELHSDGRTVGHGDSVSTLLMNGCYSMAATFKTIKEKKSSEEGWDTAIHHIESIILTYFALRDAKNVRHFVSILLLSIKAQCKDRALTTKVIKAIFGTDETEGIASYLLSSVVTPKQPKTSKPLFSDAVGLEKPQTEQDSKFQGFMQQFWNLGSGVLNLKNTAVIGKISSLMGILLALGFISDNKQFNFSVKGLELFRFQAAKGHKNMGDLLEVLMTTGAFFCERGYKCFVQGSVEPLFFDNNHDLQFDKDYTQIVANFDAVKIGDYKAAPWMDERDFELNLSNALIYCEKLLGSVDKHARPYVCKRFENLQKIHSDFELVRSTGGLRPAPFTFCVFGTSGVGKSTVVQNLLTYSLQNIARLKGKDNFEVNPDCICTLNEQDQYHSDYMGHTQAVVLDDLANASFEATDINPTHNIINFVNNIRRTAIRAEAEMKGKIQIEPLVVCATTNVRDKWARHFSNEPVAVLRRFGIHIEVTVKEGFKREGTTFIDTFRLAQESARGNYTPDAWEFTLYEYIGLTQGPDSPQKPASNPILYMKDGEMVKAKNVDFGVVMDIFQERIKAHLIAQESVVSASNSTFSRTLCPHGKFSDWCSECKSIKCKPVKRQPAAPTKPQLHSDSRTLQVSDNVGWLVDEYERLRKIPLFDWVSWIPKSTFQKKPFQWGLSCLRSRDYLGQCIFSTKCYMSGLMLSSYAVGSTVLFPGISLFCFSAMAVASARKNYLMKKISESRELMPYLIKNVRDADIDGGKKLCAVFGAFLAIHAMYKSLKSISSLPGLVPDGNTYALPVETENVWLRPELEPLPQGLNVSHSVVDLSTVVAKQQAYLEFRKSGEEEFDCCNGLFIDSNCLLIPNHMKPEKLMYLKVQMTSPETLSGKNFVCMIAPEQCVTITPTTRSMVTKIAFGAAKSDLCLCYIASSGSMKSLWNFFPESLSTRPIVTRLVWKNNKGYTVSWKTRFSSFGTADTNSAEFTNGAYYTLSEPGFGGLCMAIHLHDSASKSYIAGFHLASCRSTKSLNCAEMVSRADLRAARELLNGRSNVVLTSSSGHMRTEAYGIDYTPLPEIPAKSPTRFQTSGHVAIYGSLPQFNVRPKSAVIASPISDHVAEVMGVKQQWGPPATCRLGETRIPAWLPNQKYLAGAGNATQEFPAGVLAWAYEDYIAQMDRIMATPDGAECLEKVRPLTDVEIVSGIDGMRFVDAMKPTTSMGFPLNKPKRTWLIPLDPEDYDQACPTDFDEETKALANDLRDSYLKGERGYPIFKACMKDEPTKLTKDKVRVFQAAPAHFQHQIRKYNLMICHFLSSFALGTECCVGTNSQSPVWDALQRWLIAFGGERVVAGDFVAYDQHMSPNMTLLGFKVFEHIGRRAGYSEDDLTVMRGIATECAYPIVLLNGDLLQLFGSNPSGQNLTVYINSIVNSLYQRCVFKTLYPEYKGFFEDVVHLMTYGDDNKMSVHSDYPRYNHTEMQKVYNSMGIEYTMADKEADSVPYVDHTSADFLKRKSRFEPAYHFRNEDGSVHEGMWIAMLDENSIFKSLHSNLGSSSVSPDEVATQCIEGAAREWYFYGREMFERRKEQLDIIVRRMGYQDLMIDPYWYDYDERESRWLAQYHVDKFCTLK